MGPTINKAVIVIHIFGGQPFLHLYICLYSGIEDLNYKIGVYLALGKTNKHTLKKFYLIHWDDIS